MAFIGGSAAADSDAGGAATSARSAALALSAGFALSAVVIVLGCDGAGCELADGEFCSADGCGSGTTGRTGLRTVSAIAGDGSTATDGSGATVDGSD